ncbi:MAG: glutathione peroxidase [Phycisphaerae bacterium]
MAEKIQEAEAAGASQRAVAPPASQPAGIHAFVMKDIEGRDLSLSEFRGKVVLMVNVASKCGFTPQYDGMEKLYRDYKDKGLVVLGVPSNDFGAQEPGTEAEIKEFCSSKYDVTFPMLAKVPVKNGPQQCELYQYLSDKSRNGVLDAKVAWNFNKFLVGKDGRVIRHYESKVAPHDPKLIADIDAALKQ